MERVATFWTSTAAPRPTGCWGARGGGWVGAEQRTRAAPAARRAVERPRRRRRRRVRQVADRSRTQHAADRSGATSRRAGVGSRRSVRSRRRPPVGCRRRLGRRGADVARTLTFPVVPIARRCARRIGCCAPAGWSWRRRLSVYRAARSARSSRHTGCEQCAGHDRRKRRVLDVTAPPAPAPRAELVVFERFGKHAGKLVANLDDGGVVGRSDGAPPAAAPQPAALGRRGERFEADDEPELVGDRLVGGDRLQ